jgi:hypothetical protein
MERQHPEQMSPDPDVASQHHRLIKRCEGLIDCPTIKAEYSQFNTMSVILVSLILPNILLNIHE